jgi:hypothetical protein
MVLRQGDVQALRGLFTLVLVFGFLLGMLLTRIATWWRKRRPRPSRWFEDLRALIGLVAVGGGRGAGVLWRAAGAGGGRVRVDRARAGAGGGGRVLLRVALVRLS